MTPGRQINIASSLSQKSLALPVRELLLQSPNALIPIQGYLSVSLWAASWWQDLLFLRLVSFLYISSLNGLVCSLCFDGISVLFLISHFWFMTFLSWCFVH